MLTYRHFYQSIGIIYLIAFLSLYSQFRGLVGYNGILPISNVFEKYHQSLDNQDVDVYFYEFLKHGNLLVLAPVFGLTVDCTCEVLLWFGMISSCFLSCGYINFVFYLISWLSYVSLVHAGQTFLSFQWDILLCETGFLCVLSTFFFRIEQSSIPMWNFRFLAWKLMLLSGVVKLQSRCPTWENLTALEYHFATQCIPTPLAWYAHQLPSFVLRIAVALTLLIEIPLTFLLVVPFPIVRRVGVVLQVLLQAMIFLTGNYNFFNLLTVTLMLPSWYDDEFKEDAVIRKADTCKTLVRRESSFPSTSIEDGPFVSTMTLLHGIHLSRYGKIVQYLISALFIAYSVNYFISFNIMLSTAQIAWRRPWDEIKPMMLPASLVVTYTCIFLLVCSFALEMKTLSSKISSIFVYAVIVLWYLLGVWILITMLFLSATNLETIEAPLPSYIPAFITTHRSFTRPFLLSSSYGLFRRMTGVGKDRSHPNHPHIRIPTVARPEIAIEIYNGSSWDPLEFHYKPTSLHKAPMFVSPHQPRLDWQMWFAALGQYQHHPWFISFIYKFIDPMADSIAPEILALIDKDSISSSTGDNRPVEVAQAIRAKLFDYDFTNFTSANWWKRSKPREYLPVLQADNPSILEFLEAYNLSPKAYKSSTLLYEDCLATDAKITPLLDNQQIISTKLRAIIHETSCSLILSERDYEKPWRSSYFKTMITLVLGLTLIRYARYIFK
jgi:hypothetical protein